MYSLVEKRILREIELNTFHQNFSLQMSFKIRVKLLYNKFGHVIIRRTCLLRHHRLQLLRRWPIRSAYISSRIVSDHATKGVNIKNNVLFFLLDIFFHWIFLYSIILTRYIFYAKDIPEEYYKYIEDKCPLRLPFYLPWNPIFIVR